MASKRLTPTPVYSAVVRRLNALTVVNHTWDGFLTDMAEEYVPPGWYEEIDWRPDRIGRAPV